MGKLHCLELLPEELPAAVMGLSVIADWTELLLTDDDLLSWPLQQAEQLQASMQRGNTGSSSAQCS